MTALIELARTEALIRNESWGLVVDKKKYAFVFFDDDAEIWKISDNHTFRTRQFPLDISLIVSAGMGSQSEFNFKDKDKADAVPFFQIYSSGEQTPFTIELVSTTSSRSWFVRSDGIQRTQAIQASEKYET